MEIYDVTKLNTKNKSSISIISNEIIMNKDDIVYIVLLLLSILYGHFYKNIVLVYVKKWIGTVFGLFIIAMVSGWHCFHPIVSAFVCASIIKWSSKK